MGDGNTRKIEVAARERPYALSIIQTQLLNDMASMLYQINKELRVLKQEYQRNIPRGFTSSIVVSVSDDILILDRRNEPSMPWHSVTVYNNGPGSAYLATAPEGWDLKFEAPLQPNENVSIDMKGALIERIGFKCDKGKNAVLRIFYAR